MKRPSWLMRSSVRRACFCSSGQPGDCQTLRWETRDSASVTLGPRAAKTHWTPTAAGLLLCHKPTGGHLQIARQSLAKPRVRLQRMTVAAPAQLTATVDQFAPLQRRLQSAPRWQHMAAAYQTGCLMKQHPQWEAAAVAELKCPNLQLAVRAQRRLVMNPAELRCRHRLEGKRWRTAIDGCERDCRKMRGRRQAADADRKSTSCPGWMSQT